VIHYLRAVEALGSHADGKAVIAKMKDLPTEDRLMGKGYVRVDGRKIHPMHLFEVKTPEESKAPWDYYKQLATIPAEEAWRPLDQNVRWRKPRAHDACESALDRGGAADRTADCLPREQRPPAGRSRARQRGHVGAPGAVKVQPTRQPLPR
jgi:hypothetical protein